MTDASPRRVLLTGGTGFVGSELARELDRRGHDVHVLARASSDRTILDDAEITWHEGDLCDAASVERAVARVARGEAEPWIVHSAAVISYRSRDAELQRAVNVGGTRNVVEACRRQPIGRLLHISSVVAVGHSTDGLTGDEDMAFNGAALRCDYMDTKREAEELVLAAQRDLDLVIVNPGAIFGPGSSGPNTVQFVRNVARGRTGPFAPPGSLAVVGRGDVIDGCVLALERGEPGRRYLLVESVWTMLELFHLAARELGVRAPRWRLGARPWRWICAALTLPDRIVDLSPATPQAMRMLGVHFDLDARRAREELGWRPRPFEGVLRETIAWLRAAGEL